MSSPSAAFLLATLVFNVATGSFAAPTMVTPDTQVSVHDTPSNQIKAREYPKTHLVRRRLGLDLPQQHTVDVVEVKSVTSTSFPATVGGQDVEIQVVQGTTNLFVSSDDVHGPHRHWKHCPYHRGFKCTCAHKDRHHQYSEEHPQEGDEDWQGWNMPDDEIGHDVPAGQESGHKGNSTLTPSAGAPSPNRPSSPDDKKTENAPSDSKATLPHPAGPPSRGASPAQDVKTAPSPPGSGEKPLPTSQSTGAHARPLPNNGQDASGSRKPSAPEEPPATKSSDATSLKDAVPGAEPPHTKGSAPGSSNGRKSISSTPGSAEPDGDSTSHSGDIDM